VKTRVGPELEPILAKLLEEQRFAVLSTQGEAGPYASLVAYTLVGGLHTLVFATPRESRKVANLRAEPRVALLIDNASNDPRDLQKSTAITALGTAAEASPEHLAELRAAYVKRHPYLEAFVADQGTALVQVEVTSYIVVGPFQQVREVVLPKG